MSGIDQMMEQLEEELHGEDLERLLELKKTYEGPDELITAEKYQEGIKQEEVLYKAMSGIPSLDGILEGFRPGNVIIVSGPTKQGKTTLCQTLTTNMTNDGYKCLWFSFDTPPIELIERFPSLPTFYLPKRNEMDKKIEWIESKVIEGLAKYDSRIVFIDHLGFLSRFSDQHQNYATELTSIVRELKAIAIRWNITIFLNHHIRSIPAETVPNWSHLKDSSGVAQDSDITIMVWRNRRKMEFGGIEYDPTSSISVQLHRRTGRTGTVRVNFKNNLLYEITDEQINEEDF